MTDVSNLQSPDRSRVAAEWLYAFLWLEFRGKETKVNDLTAKFHHKMRCAPKDFIERFGAPPNVSKLLDKYDAELFDIFSYPEHVEDGKRYPGYKTVRPKRDGEGLLSHGVMMLSDTSKAMLISELPDSDNVTELVKFDFAKLEEILNENKYSLMAETLWIYGYERRANAPRDVLTSVPEYRGRNFAGIATYKNGNKSDLILKYVFTGEGEVEERVNDWLQIASGANVFNGELVFGTFDKDGTPILRADNNRCASVLYWKDFLESEQYDSIEDWLVSGDGSLGLFPMVKTLTRDVVVLDADLVDGKDYTGRFYAGLIMDFLDGRVHIGRIQRSREKDYLVDDIDFLCRQGRTWIPRMIGDEEIHVCCVENIGNPKWTTMSELVSDVEFWESIESELTTKESPMDDKQRYHDWKSDSRIEVPAIGIFDGTEEDGNGVKKSRVKWVKSCDGLPLFKSVLAESLESDNSDFLISGLLVSPASNEYGTRILLNNVKGMYRESYMQIRDFSEFEESATFGDCISEFLRKRQEDAELTPKFKYFTPQIIVMANERPNAGKKYFYVGFELDENGRYKPGKEVAVSRFTMEDLQQNGLYYLYFCGGYDRFPGRSGVVYKKFSCGFDPTEEFFLVDIKNSKPYPISNIFLQAKRSDSPGEKFSWSLVKYLKTPEEREREFLAEFIDYVTNKCGFRYSDRDLLRFHACMKCGKMTLLGGAPGCGKSKLAELYARAIAGECYSDKAKGNDGDNNTVQTYLRVDVNPAWLEPADMMGYYSPSPNGKDYHPAPCGLYEFLGQNRDLLKSPPPIVCFEEMNLSRIEFYFSEFIQMLSRDENKLPTYGLSMPAEVRFIGTYNDDATTQRMSSRFLDRCNVVVLTDQFDDANPFSFKRGIVVSNQGCGVSLSEYGKWKKGIEEVKGAVVEHVNELYRKIIGGLSEKGVKSGDLDIRPSPRVREEILLYIVNRTFTETVEEKVRIRESFDEAFAQRVLSKCRPGPLLGDKYQKLADVLGAIFGNESISLKCVKALRGQSRNAMWAEEDEGDDVTGK